MVNCKRETKRILDRLHDPMTQRHALLILTLLACPAPGHLSAQPPDPGVPPEERRLDESIFRSGLKRRGLDELLELHLRDFPPRDVGSRLMMERDIKLAQFADASLPWPERRGAITEANRLLARLIELRANDPERLEWRLTLAKSLIHDEAEPYYSSILFRGGSRADREQLAALTGRALDLLTRLKTEIAGEFERIDELTAAQFETLERNGVIQRLDNMGPEVDYRLLWALFYDALPRDSGDAAREQRLAGVLAGAAEIEGLLDTPHEQSRVQVQALLLLGMTHRRLGDRPAAREHLDRAVQTAEGLADVQQRAEVDWAVTLALADRIRVEIDAGEYDDALARIEQFNGRAAARSGDTFPLRLVAALLERDCFRARAAAAARQAGQRAEAVRFRNAAWRPLARLAKREPQRRDEIYATINDVVGLDADPATLDPFEQCALIAGLLHEAGPQNTEGPLQRAVTVGKGLLDKPGEIEADLVPEVLYNTGVALFRLGRLLEAAEAFARIGREHPQYDRALQAATLAVQICAKIYPAQRDNAAVRDLYLAALDTLVKHFGHAPEAKYWRYFYAQTLEDVGRFDEAARQYGLLGEDHEHYLDALLHRMRCLLRVLDAPAGVKGLSPAEQQTAVNDFLAAQRVVVTKLTPAAQAEKDEARAAALRGYLAQATVLYAEAHTLAALNRPEKAIEILDKFEEQHPGAKDLLGRVLRVRVLALEKLGRIDEATALIPVFLEVDPDSAGPALQSLYLALSADSERLEELGDDAGAKRKAETALLLAERIDEWARDPRNKDRVGGAAGLALQLAEANLRAGRYEKARDLFSAYLGLPAGSKTPEAKADLRGQWGFAEALYQSGDYAAALPLFNRLFRGLPDADKLRFRALLRDLQCRTALGDPADGIIKVIQQQETLHPELGPSGTTRVAKEFQALKRENEKRR